MLKIINWTAGAIVSLALGALSCVEPMGTEIAYFPEYNLTGSWTMTFLRSSDGIPIGWARLEIEHTGNYLYAYLQPDPEVEEYVEMEGNSYPGSKYFGLDGIWVSNGGYSVQILGVAQVGNRYFEGRIDMIHPFSRQIDQSYHFYAIKE